MTILIYPNFLVKENKVPVIVVKTFTSVATNGMAILKS